MLNLFLVIILKLKGLEEVLLIIRNPRIRISFSSSGEQVYIRKIRGGKPPKADKQKSQERIVTILHFYNILHFAQNLWSKMELFLLIFFFCGVLRAIYAIMIILRRATVKSKCFLNQVLASQGTWWKQSVGYEGVFWYGVFFWSV